MRRVLEVRSQAKGTGTGDSWELSGKDERVVRDALIGLDGFAVEPPVEEYDRRRYRHVVKDDGRWRAALLWPDESRGQFYPDFEPRQAEAAWSADGALALAEVLPEQLADIAEALRARFGCGR
jgi:hypothetical protein